MEPTPVRTRSIPYPHHFLIEFDRTGRPLVRGVHPQALTEAPAYVDTPVLDYDAMVARAKGKPAMRVMQRNDLLTPPFTVYKWTQGDPT